MRASLTEKGKDTAVFTITMAPEDWKDVPGDGKPSQEAVERKIRICCRQALAELGLEASERFEIDCGAFTEEGLTAVVKASYVPFQEVTGYKGVEVRGLTGKDARQRMLDAALEAAVDRSGLSAPQHLVDNEFDRLLAGLQHRLHYEALAAGSANFFIQKELEESAERLQEQAVRQVKTDLLLKGVIRQEKLEASEEELEAEARRIAREQEMPLELVKEFLGGDLSMIRSDLLVRKAQDFILDHAVIL